MAIEETSYQDVEPAEIPQIVNSLETEICDMLSDPVLHPAKLRRTLAVRNALLEAERQEYDGVMQWADEILERRKASAAEETR